jgi:hypothetical protein
MSRRDLIDFATRWRRSGASLVLWIQPTLVTWALIILWRILGIERDSLPLAIICMLGGTSGALGAWVGLRMSKHDSPFVRIMLTAGAITTIGFTNAFFVLAGLGLVGFVGILGSPP